MNEFQRGELKHLFNDTVDKASEIGLKMTPVGPGAKSIDEIVALLRTPSEKQGGT